MGTQDESDSKNERFPPENTPPSGQFPNSNLPESGDSESDEQGGPLAGLPADERQEVLRAEIIRNPEILEDPRVLVAVRRITRSGPLPAPEDFAAYEAALPGAADRILRMAENSLQGHIDQQKVVGACDEKRLSNDLVEALTGQVFGLIVCLCLAFGGYKLIEAGHDVAGGAFIGVPAVAMVGHFIFGRAKAKNGRPKRDEDE